MTAMRLVTSCSCSVPVPVRLLSCVRNEGRAPPAAPRPAAGSLKRDRLPSPAALNGSEAPSSHIKPEVQKRPGRSERTRKQKNSQNEEMMLLKCFTFSMSLIIYSSKTIFLCVSKNVSVFTSAFSAALFILTFYYY